MGIFSKKPPVEKIRRKLSPNFSKLSKPRSFRRDNGYLESHATNLDMAQMRR